MPARDLATIELIDSAIENMTVLKKAGTEIKHRLHKLVLNGGRPARTVADLLHGTWLGHPLHPVLTDATVGAWTFGAVFDLLANVTGQRKMRHAADMLTEMGLVTAGATAVTGLTDYSTIKQEAVEYGAAHALLNTTATVLYLLSVRARRMGERDTGVTLSTLGFGAVMVSAWLGGELVYRHRVGVDHADREAKPEDWTPVLSIIELNENESRRVEVEGLPILLYRHNGEIMAVGATCAHAGGPLNEGTFDGYCVQCPWHDSVYDLRDGDVVHGPSTYRQPTFETRLMNGQIEVRASSAQ
jgi:nitrite reductase/ring-hydroxylating ferredoxin subunit/uncharacterized membrane protein